MEIINFHDIGFWEILQRWDFFALKFDVKKEGSRSLPRPCSKLFGININDFKLLSFSNANHVLFSRNTEPSTWEQQILAPPNDLIATKELEFELGSLQPNMTYKIKISVMMHDIENAPSSSILTIKTLAPSNNKFATFQLKGCTSVYINLSPFSNSAYHITTNSSSWTGFKSRRSKRYLRKNRVENVQWLWTTVHRWCPTSI